MYRLLQLCVCFLLLIGATVPPHTPVYQEVVTVGDLPLDQLRRSTVAYLRAVDQEKPKRHRHRWHANVDSTTFTFDSDLLLYNRKAVKHPLGEVTYRTTIDLKVGKYRYTADSAYFREYRRNRYSRYVPSRRPPVAWERAQLELSEKEQQRVYRTFNTRFQALRNFMQAHIQVATATPTTDQDW